MNICPRHGTDPDLKTAMQPSQEESLVYQNDDDEDIKDPFIWGIHETGWYVQKYFLKVKMMGMLASLNKLD